MDHPSLESQAMAATIAPLPASPRLGVIRLAACPTCQHRWRSLSDVGGRLTARCLRCGTELRVPLGTERARATAVVGRGGQPLSLPG